MKNRLYVEVLKSARYLNLIATTPIFKLELSSLELSHKCKSRAIASHVIAKRYHKL